MVLRKQLRNENQLTAFANFVKLIPCWFHILTVLTLFLQHKSKMYLNLNFTVLSIITVFLCFNTIF